MSNPITVAQLEQYRQQIRSGGVDGAAQVYASLYAQGYNYAGWAGGVAEGNTLSGVGALSFIQGNTLDYSGNPRGLTKEQMDKIRIDMAIRTIDEYINIAEGSGGDV